MVLLIISFAMNKTFSIMKSRVCVRVCAHARAHTHACIAFMAFALKVSVWKYVLLPTQMS